MRFGKKVIFEVSMGHLVIWRSFGDTKLNFDKRNWLSVPERQIVCSKVRFGKKVMFEVRMGHLRSLEFIWRSFGDSKLKSDKRNQLNIWKIP